MSLRDRIEYFVFLGRHEGWVNSRVADAILSDPEIAALRDVAENAAAYRHQARSGHHRDCGYWRKEATCSCLLADAAAALDAALARLEEVRRG